MARKRKIESDHGGPDPPPPGDHPPPPLDPPPGTRLDPPDTRTVVKAPFHDIFQIRDPVLHERLAVYLQRYHALGEHATHALKRFVIQSDPPPLITKEHIEAILYLLNKGEIWQPRSPTKIVIRSTLIPHVEQYRALLGLPLMGMDVDQQPINFLTASIFTNLKVNIEQHFVQMLFRYINHRLGKFLNIPSFNKRCISFYSLNVLSFGRC